jgi:hypothetical protein
MIGVLSKLGLISILKGDKFFPYRLFVFLLFDDFDGLSAVAMI